jgi:DNA polymerase V
MSKNKLTFFRPDLDNPIEIPFITAGIKAGFPSPAADFDENKISLDAVLVKASGVSMIGAGIDDGDIMVIDRSLEPGNNKIAVCLLDGEFTVKRIKVSKDEMLLMPENKAFEPIKITEENQLIIWGIVTYVIKKMY